MGTSSYWEPYLNLKGEGGCHLNHQIMFICPRLKSDTRLGEEELDTVLINGTDARCVGYGRTSCCGNRYLPTNIQILHRYRTGL